MNTTNEPKPPTLLEALRRLKVAMDNVQDALNDLREANAAFQAAAAVEKGRQS